MCCSSVLRPLVERAAPRGLIDYRGTEMQTGPHFSDVFEEEMLSVVFQSINRNITLTSALQSIQPQTGYMYGIVTELPTAKDGSTKQNIKEDQFAVQKVK